MYCNNLASLVEACHQILHLVPYEIAWHLFEYLYLMSHIEDNKLCPY